MRPLGVLVVSEGCAAVDALCAGITSDKTLRLAGRCRACGDVPAATGAGKPDVAVLDLRVAADTRESIRMLSMRCGAPVLALGGHAGNALISLDAGAADFVLLPSPGSDSDMANFTADALDRIRAAFFAGEAVAVQGGAAKKRIRLLAVACAQGGPVALACLIKRLPKVKPAVLVLQRDANAFSKDYARVLSGMCGCAVAECRDGMELEPGNTYLACDCGVTVEKNGDKLIMHTYEGTSADTLFAAAAEALGSEAACVLISGNGAEGLERAASRGALAIAQNKNALLRELGFKLPGGVLEMPLEDIAAVISPCTGLSG